jgi:hypothetical protein
MTRDIKIYETGNGGDINVLGNDLESVYSFENMPYLAMFGGNVEQSTNQVGEDDEQRFDYWGNSFLIDAASQFNSLTERGLITTPITSEGRILIENLVRADLEFMRDFAVVTVTVRVISDDKLNIDIGITEPSNLQNLQFQFIWDAATGAILGGLNVNDNYVTPPTTTEVAERLLQSGGYRLLESGGRRLLQ